MRGARGRFWGWGGGGAGSPYPRLVSPSSLAFPAVRVAGCRVRVPAIPCGLCVPQARSTLPFGSAPCARCVCVCSCSGGVRAPPPPPSRCGARTARGTCAGRPQGRSKRFVPLRVSCPGPVSAYLARGGGGGGGWPGPFVPLLGSGSLVPSWAGLCVRGGPASGGAGGGVVRGGGGACVSLPLGRGRARVGWGALGLGGGEPLVCPSATPAWAPRLASSASLRPWTVRSPCCSGSCPCASARALPEGGAAGRLGAPAGDRSPGGQAWGSVTPRRGPVTGLQMCVVRLAEVMGEAGV